MAESKSLNTSAKSAVANPAAINTTDGVCTKITALFFDLDNTLIPTRSGDSKACRKLAELLENQFSFTKEESSLVTQSYLKSFRRCPDNSQTSLDSWRTYLWREALPDRYKHLAEQIYPKWLQLRYRCLALPQSCVQMLRRFREAGFLLALITNGPSNAQWEKIKKLHVSQYFDCILVSSDLPWEKPNPNIFFAACNFLGVKPAECAMVGDKLETDIKGGRLANLAATFWTPLNQAEIDLSDVAHPPDVILRNIVDMCKFFPALTGAAASGAASSSGMVTNSNNATQNAVTNLQTRRRGSQISCSGTSSTCDSDLHRHQVRHYRHQNHQSSHGYNKYRRAGSLPAIESFNSETENSLDSIFG